jgi:uncharacterized membrane protein
MGLSFWKISSESLLSAMLMTLGGATIGLFGAAVGLLVHRPVEAFERRRGSRKLLGLRLMTAGFIVAVLGWLLAVFLSGRTGYWLVVVGVVGGVVGIVIHYMNIFRPAD